MAGIAVAPQVHAVEAAASVLNAGGNAIDAAITAAFVQMIVTPQQAGIGGFGVGVIHTADGTSTLVDFNGTAGSKVTPTMWQDKLIEQDWTGHGFHLEGKVNIIGYQSIMTPGTVAGMAEILDQHGTYSWGKVIDPAIKLASDGFTVSPALWTYWNLPTKAMGVTNLERLQVTNASRQIYFKNQHETYKPGDTLKNPDYAQVLERLAANGPEYFYRGQLAEQMVDDLTANGSFITADDLATYKPRVERPLQSTYRGLEILTNAPAGGGICLAQMLNILEHEDIKMLGLNSTDYIDFVARAMQAGCYDWYGKVGDPRFADVPVKELISKEHAEDWYRRIKNGERIRVPMRRESPGTTHVTVADTDGNVIALTHSLGQSSGVVTPGLGFTYNNIMNDADPVPGSPNSIAPGKSRITGMTPTIVLRDGKPIVALGAPGGTRIITGVLQGLVNIIDHGLSPQEAVDAPRFDAQSEVLDCEARIPTWQKTELAKRGFTIAPNASIYGNFSRVQAVTIDPSTGELAGGADPRGGGGAVMRG